MSINAISSVSLYEYYYKINKSEETPKEPKNTDIKPIGDEAENTVNKNAQIEPEDKKEVSGQEQNRPWADIMDQLGLSFKIDPKDDVKAIKSALNNLTKDIDDAELLADIKDLDDYVKTMYITYYNNDYDSSKVSSSLSKELESISAINKGLHF